MSTIKTEDTDEVSEQVSEQVCKQNGSWNEGRSIVIDMASDHAEGHGNMIKLTNADHDTVVTVNVVVRRTIGLMIIDKNLKNGFHCKVLLEGGRILFRSRDDIKINHRPNQHGKLFGVKFTVIDVFVYKRGHCLLLAN